jgi:uncharacterized protein YndB with AHSA1/START domain
MTDPRAPDPDSIRLERTVSARAESVFDAWLRPEVLRRWWQAGADWETPVAEVDPRVGGRLRLVMRSPDGEEFGGSGEYLELERPTRLVFTWTWDRQEGHEETQVIEVDFDQRADGTTQVVVTNRGLPDEESRQSHRQGWEASLDHLDGVLAVPAPLRIDPRS